VKETAPVVKETAPVVKETAPVVKETAPVVKETPAVVAPAPKSPVAPKVEEASDNDLPASMTSSLDAWFKTQQRDLQNITGRMQGSPVRENAPKAAGGTPQSLKDWVSENKVQEEVIAKKNQAKSKEADQSSTSIGGFDMWLERQRKELSGITERLEEASQAPMSTEDWRKKLDEASNKTLEQWRTKSEVTQVKAKDESIMNMMRTSDKSVRELERSLHNMSAKSESHQSLLKQNDLLTEELQYTKLNNLSNNMEDRLYAA